MKFVRNTISIILALLMVISAVPTTALAAQQDISGNYISPDGDEFDLYWSYTASTDTLYLDGEIVGNYYSDSPEENYKLPLYYIDENENEVLWEGSFSNVVFSNKVITLAASCLGTDNWNSIDEDGEYITDSEFYNVSFEENSKLKHIAEYAFYGYKIDRIIVPDTVHTIGCEAFSEGQYNLIRLPHYSPSGVIGEEEFQLFEGAFAGSIIDSIDFNNCPIDTITNDSFFGTYLNHFSLPEGIKVIEYEAFSDTKFENDLIIPSSVQTIGSYCFAGCRAKKITFPEYDSEKEIVVNSYAFARINAQEIDFNDCNIDSIPLSAFESATIQKLSLSNHITSFDSYAFRNSKIYCDLKFPEELYSVGAYAFGYAKLDKIIFNNNINVIKGNAFSSCTVSKESVLYISQDVFNQNNGSIPFRGSNIKIVVLGSSGAIEDYEQHDVSGFYDAENNNRDLNWSYNSSTDTLYLDAVEIECINCDGLKILPLYYQNDDGNNCIWRGAYHNVVYSNNVTDLGENCLGIPDWSKSDYINVNFEEGSKLEFIYKSFIGAKIKSLVLPDTVYGISNYAFQDSYLEYIKLPNYKGDEVPELGAYAFSGCKEGLEIDFNGYNIESLYPHLFEESTVTLNNLPNSIEEISSYAFSDTTIENEIIIPKSVKYIQRHAFENTKFKQITFDDNIEDLVIAQYAFAGSNIKTFHLSSKISSLGPGAFSNCKSLITVTADNDFALDLPSSIFNNCKALQSIDIPKSVETISSNAFSGCSKLSEINFANNSSLTVIEEAAFSNCSSIDTIAIPMGVTKIGKQAFFGCSNLLYVYLPSSLVELGEGVFSSDLNLINVNIPSGITEIPAHAFESCFSLNLVIPDTVKTIGDYAFNICENLKCSISGATTFGDYCLRDTGIETVDLSNSSETINIGEYAFYFCKNLKTVSLENCTVNSIGTAAFADCSELENFIMPSSLSVIPDYFVSGSVIEHINLPANLTKIGKYAFAVTHISDITIPSKTGNIDDYAFGDCIYLSSVTFEEGYREVFYIGEYAFFECISLTSIDVPKYVKSISECCFALSGLQSVSLPSTLSTIEALAFAYTPLESIAIPNNVHKICYAAFQECAMLSSVSLTDKSKLTVIDSDAFNGCEALTQIYLPDTMTTIGSSAFMNCSFTEIVLPENCKYVDVYAFADNPLQKLTVLGRTTSLKEYSFFYDTNNENYDTNGIIYGHNISNARVYANLHSIQFEALDSPDDPPEDPPVEEEITTSGTFSGGTWKITSTSSKKTLTINGENIDSLFAEDENGIQISFTELANRFEIDTLYIGNGITTIPDYFMYDETGVGIKYVRLPNSIQYIGDWAFAGTSIVKIYNDSRTDVNSYIPKNVTHIGKYAFAYTDSLEYEFELPRELTEISEGLFYNSNVKNVAMFGKVKKIGKKAFAECANMTSLYVPCSVTDIYTDGDVNNNGFGFINGSASKDLWVIGRKDSFAHQYCKQNSINFSEHNGLPYSKGRIDDSKYSGTYRSMYWEYYIEDDYLILYNTENTVNLTPGYRYVEYDSDLKGYSATKTITGSDDIFVKPKKIYIDKIKEFTAPLLLSYFDPEEIEVNISITKIGDSTFENCSKIESISLPDPLNFAGKRAFANCKSLKNVRLGKTITDISEGMFYECRSIESVDLGNVILKSIGPRAFYNCNALKFVNLSNRTSYNLGSIGEYAFYNCVNLQEINIPDNIKTIGEKAFYNCVQAQRLTLSGSVTSIEKDAFANLFYCEEIDINSEVNPTAFTNEKDIFSNLGAYTNGIELNIGNAVENLNCEFFKNLKITKINLGSNVNKLLNKQYLFELKELSAPNSSIFTVKNNCLYRADTLELVPQTLTSVSIDSSTKMINDYALYGTNAKSIVIPDSVTAIGESSFENSKSLIGITLPDGINEIPQNAFKDCVKLRLVNLPENTFIIRESAFEGCESLVSAVFNNSLGIIGKNAFKDCTKLEGLAFPEELTNIAEGAFMNCSSLKYAYIWYTQIGANSFKNCNKLNIFTPVRSDAYRYAREFDIPYSAYTDEELFFDEWAIKVDALAGYLGYCEEGGHGNIQYLTVYEADCENDGFVIGVCEYCSEILEEVHIDAYGHNYKIETYIPATNTTKGMTVHTCDRCSQSYTEYTEPLDENFVIETHTVSGKIELSADKYATAGLAPAKNASITIDGMVVATADSNGEFTFELETGTYEAQIRYAYGFTRTIYIQVRNQDIRYRKPIVIIGCDFSKDGIINDEDIKLFEMIISAKKDDPSYLSFVDLNADGYINAKDMLYIKQLSGLNASTFRYPSLIIT